MKTPKFLSKLSAILTPRPRKKLQASARALPRAAMEDYDAEEPTTRLSSAFIVVFILHVVAIGGIYAFTCIKEARAANPSPNNTAAPTEKTKAPSAAEAKAPAPAATSATSRVAENGGGALAPVPTVAQQKPVAPRTHVVKAGENPTKIAFAYNLKTDELLAANGLKDGVLLQVGQTLTIPTPKPVIKPVALDLKKPDVAPKQTDVPPTKTTPGLRIVKKGDTATSIAKAYGITAADLLKYNKITDATKLQLGQALKIPPKKG